MAVLSPIIFRYILTEKVLPEEEEQVFELVTIGGEPLEGGFDIDRNGLPDNWVEVMD